MALANVAIVLARLGRKVLVADWDIEAPGLDRYFARPGVRVDRKTPGIVDFVTQFQHHDPQSWRKWVKELPVPNGKHIHLLHAGIDDADYPERLRSIDWNVLFEQGLGNTLEQWRNDACGLYDYVLIDSRTGLTDVGGVCSILLPDYVVALFTSNEQSVDGTFEAMNRAKAAHAQLPLDRSKLLVVPIPARDESNTEYEKAREWRTRYGQKLAPLLSDWMPIGKNPLEVFDFLKIPHVPFWSFGEQLPVLSEDARNPKTLAYSYSLIARLLDSGLDWSEVTGASEQALASELAQRAESDARAKEAEVARLKAEESLRYSLERRYQMMKEIAYGRLEEVRGRFKRSIRQFEYIRVGAAVLAVYLLIGLGWLAWTQFKSLSLFAVLADGPARSPAIALSFVAFLTVLSAALFYVLIGRKIESRNLALTELNAEVARFELQTIDSLSPTDSLVSELLEKINMLDTRPLDRSWRYASATLDAPSSRRLEPAAAVSPSPVPNTVNAAAMPPELQAELDTNRDVVIWYQPSGISRDWLREFTPLLRVWLSEQLGRDANVGMIPLTIDSRSGTINSAMNGRSPATIVVLTEGFASSSEVLRMLDSAVEGNNKTVLLWLGRPNADSSSHLRFAAFPTFDFSDLAYIGEGFSRTERYLDFQDRVRDLARALAIDMAGMKETPAA